MTLTTKAVLVVGLLLLSSAQAWARKSAASANEGGNTSPEQHSGAMPGALAYGAPATGYERPRRRYQMPNDRLRSAQGKGPVDVMSLSLGGALACFFALAILRRRKSRRVSKESNDNLPTARVLHSEGLRDTHDDRAR